MNCTKLPKTLMEAKYFIGGGQVVQIRFINSLPAGRYIKKM
jgi:hypothetical protein